MRDLGEIAPRGAHRGMQQQYSRLLLPRSGEVVDAIGEAEPVAAGEIFEFGHFTAGAVRTARTSASKSRHRDGRSGRGSRNSAESAKTAYASPVPLRGRHRASL